MPRATQPRLKSVAKTASGYGSSGYFYTDAKQPTEAWVVLIDNDGQVGKQLEYGGPAAESANAISTAPAGGFVFGGATASRGQGNTDQWKSSASQVKANVEVTTDTSFVQIEQTP